MKKVIDPVIGSFAVSVRGGDIEKMYIVVGFEDNGYLLLCDGERHKLASPKRKNVKHVKVLDAKVDKIPKTDALVVTAIRRHLRG